MDELRKAILEYLHKNHNREKDFYDVVKNTAMEFAAGFPSVSKEPFRKVYDVVSETVQDFWFREGK